MSASSKPKLYYIAIRGRGELTRLVLAASNTEFEDIRYSLGEFREHTSDSPSGTLPYVDTGDKNKSLLVQSGAIARYYAKKAGLMGNSDWEYYLIERAMGQIDDVFQEIVKIIMAPQDKKAEAKKEFQGEKTQRLLTCLVKFLKENGEFYAGKSITLADLASLALTDNLTTFGPELLTKFPELAEHKQRVMVANVRVAEWIKNRPETPF